MKKILISTIVILAIMGLAFYVNNKQANNTASINQSSSNMEQELIIETLKEGAGEVTKVNDKITVHYTGWLEDGAKFDSSVDRGQPFVFTLGIGQVIQGWDNGMLGAKIGEKRKLTIPPSLAYGETGMNPIIPPNATLIFEVEIINIQ